MGQFAVNRPVSVLMLTLVMILFGLAAYMRLPSDLFPNVSQPGLVVHTAYEGAASSEIEQTVTKTLEEKLGSVKNLISMKSVSGEERSDIALTFGWGTNMDLAAMDVRAKLDEVSEDLPEEAEDPVVLRTSSGAGSVMVLNVATNASASDGEDVDLRNVVTSRIKPRLERVNGVAAVSVQGGKEYEVRVKVKPERLTAYGLSILDIEAALERENLSQRGGKLKEENTQFLIRTVGSFTVKSLPQLIVSRPGETIRRLGEVADVSSSRVTTAPESFARLKTAESSEALPSVEIGILKKSGGNSVAICESVLQKRVEVLYELAKLRAEPPLEVTPEMLLALGSVPTGKAPPTPELVKLDDYIRTQAPIEIAVSYNESVFISESLEMVQSNGLQGLILASIILLVFLRRIQSTVIVVLSMPVSVIATFSLFYAGGISVNIFSMAGLTLAVGMVVDNAIVVTEAIFHKLQHERRVKKAIIEAVLEIGPAVWASTLTTVAVFLPIVFVPGIAGQIFRDLSWVITYTLVFSIIVAFTLIPMLTMQVMTFEFALFDLINKIIDTILSPLVAVAGSVVGIYKRVLTLFVTTLSARLVLIVVMLFAFVGVMFLIPPTEFFPDTKVESYALTVRPRVGQTLEAVDTAARRIEALVGNMPNARRFNASVSPREIRILVAFDKAAVMSGSINPMHDLAQVEEKIRKDAFLGDRILDYTIESLNPMKSLLGTSGGDIILKVRGPDLDTLHHILAGKDGEGGLLKTLRDERTKLGIATIGKTAAGVPEWVLRVKRDAAADRGLTLSEIADQVETAVAGTKATDITINDVAYDIVLRSGAKLTGRNDLLNLDLIVPGSKRAVKLREVVELKEQQGHLSILREERERTLYVPIFVDKSRSTLGEVVYMLNQAGGPVDTAVEPYRPEGYNITLGGASEAMNESLGYMAYAFAVAIILVYMVMASQFESLIHPFTIMFSVPLSLIGAIIGLRLSGDSLSLTAVIGIIMLAGIVVNNAIILIDYINILRARGMTRDEAIVEAGLTRLRPIFMTTLTTVLGMGPLALGYGTGAELYKPLAVVVVGGLSLSTMLTLVFIPAVYCFADDVMDLVGFISFRVTMMFSRTE